jgi:Ca2+-binding RTX toxin-like protein
MAQFKNYNIGPFWGASLGNPATNGSYLLYVNSDSVGYLCADGTYVYFEGSGFTYGLDSQGRDTVTSGTVTGIRHFNDLGESISVTSGIKNAPINSLFTLAKQDAKFTVSQFEQLALSGNDLLYMRARTDNAIINDVVNGWGGDDSIWAGTGNDEISGDSGHDRLGGDDGDDRIAGGFGNDQLWGGRGNDVMSGGAGTDIIDGGDGADTVFYLGNFKDLTIKENSAGFTVTSAEHGTDRLSNVERIATNDGVYEFNDATGKWDKISEANQRLMLTSTLETENGDSGNNTFQASVGTISQPSLDLIFGGAGNDKYEFKGNFQGQGVNNVHGLVYAYGGTGDDIITVGISTDRLVQNPSGTFRFFGEAGKDTLAGGAGADLIDGGSGDDKVNGGMGNDTLVGGRGYDVFQFNNSVASGASGAVRSGNDVITDFDADYDTLSFTNTVNLSLTETDNGLLVTATFKADGTVAGTVLLQNVYGDYTLNDLLT